MKAEEIEQAVILAKMFVARAEDLALAGLAEYGTHPKECGALRRASMDLTRQLARMRDEKRKL